MAPLVRRARSGDAVALQDLAASDRRREDGFDYAAAAVVDVDRLQVVPKALRKSLTHADALVADRMAWRAWRAAQWRQAYQGWMLALDAEPNEPHWAALASEAAFRAGDRPGALSALRRLRFDDDTPRAFRAWRWHLSRRLGLLGRVAVQHDAVRLLAPRGSADADAFAAELANAVRRASATLRVPLPDVTAYLVAAPEGLRAIEEAPHWGAAYFGDVLYLDAGVREHGSVLAHEALHAALRRTPVPAWVDEGLAQYFAGECAPAHLHSWRVMAEHQTWIPFSALQDTFVPLTDRRDARMAYHQSLAMVALAIQEGYSPADLVHAAARLRPHQLWAQVVRGRDARALFLGFLEEQVLANACPRHDASAQPGSL